MYIITYSINKENLDDEQDWLRLQKVTASFQLNYNWVESKEYISVGMVVNSDTALLIKLRHGKITKHLYPIKR